MEKIEKNNEEINVENKKKKNNSKKIIFIAIFCIIIMKIISVGLFSYPACSTTIWNAFANTINEVYQELTSTDNELIPNFRDEDVDAKPIIYLYPEKEIDIEVKLDNIDFTATYPEYINGWEVKAKPNGVLVDKNNREYNYLYWEGYSNYKSDFSEGFVVAKDDYISFLEEKLGYVGMIDREVCDFISYWLPICNEYDYMLMSFQKDYGKKVKIDYSIKPDNELVVFVAFKGLDKPIDIEEQDLNSYKEFKREGFVAVEWGGEIIK